MATISTIAPGERVVLMLRGPRRHDQIAGLTGEIVAVDGRAVRLRCDRRLFGCYHWEDDAAERIVPWTRIADLTIRPARTLFELGRPELERTGGTA